MPDPVPPPRFHDRAHVFCRVVDGEQGVAGFLQWMNDRFLRVENVVMVPVGGKPVGKVHRANGPGMGAIILYAVTATGFGVIEPETPPAASTPAPAVETAIPDA